MSDPRYALKRGAPPRVGRSIFVTYDEDGYAEYHLTPPRPDLKEPTGPTFEELEVWEWMLRDEEHARRIFDGKPKRFEWAL